MTLYNLSKNNKVLYSSNCVNNVLHHFMKEIRNLLDSILDYLKISGSNFSLESFKKMIAMYRVNKLSSSCKNSNESYITDTYFFDMEYFLLIEEYSHLSIKIPDSVNLKKIISFIESHHFTLLTKKPKTLQQEKLQKEKNLLKQMNTYRKKFTDTLNEKAKKAKSENSQPNEQVEESDIENYKKRLNLSVVKEELKRETQMNQEKKKELKVKEKERKEEDEKNYRKCFSLFEGNQSTYKLMKKDIEKKIIGGPPKMFKRRYQILSFMENKDLFHNENALEIFKILCNEQEYMLDDVDLESFLKLSEDLLESSSATYQDIVDDFIEFIGDTAIEYQNESDQNESDQNSKSEQPLSLQDMESNIDNIKGDVL